jgi:uncharacterized hydrophobic protein (TIGR00271 family)
MKIDSSWIRPLISIAMRMKKLALIEIEGDQEEVASRIIPDIEIRGIRFWFLLSSCIIASIGLNTNSVAVIIGAMLVSPLMGPILGLGLGLAIQSRDTIELAARNLAWAVGGSLLISTLYFGLSPLDEATPEILARTAPTLLDLVVAIASAFAGVIAFTSRGTMTIIPGVAIATAIMPPLCTAGYGIASRNVLIAFGGFYLFAVNAFAITIVAFLLFKRMHFHEREEDVQQNKTLPRAITAALVVAFMAPLSWTFYRLWKDSSVQRQVRALVRSNTEELDLVNWHFEKGKNNPKLTLYAFKQVSPEKTTSLSLALARIHPRAELNIRQATESEETRELISKFKASPLFPALSDSSFVTKWQQSASLAVAKPDFNSLQRELSAWLDSSMRPVFFVSPSAEAEMRSEFSETLLLIEYDKALPRAEKERFEQRMKDWHRVRVPETGNLKIIWQSAAPDRTPESSRR